MDRLKCSDCFKGAAKMAKALLVCAPPAVVKVRRDACKTCPHLTSVLRVAQCGVCGCAIIPKTRLPKEECPLEGEEKRWTAADTLTRDTTTPPSAR